MSHFEFDKRMKFYEGLSPASTRCIPHLPTLIRLDGRGFHRYTRNMNKPFDTGLSNAFKYTTEKLVEKTNALIGYTQSDEITLLLYDQGILSRSILFDGKLYKLLSVVTSMCTSYFNLYMDHIYATDIEPANFDCRVFQVPNKQEAVNVFLWREQDAVRNSIQALGQSFFSHKELHKKSCSDIQEMCFQKGQNWSNLSDYQKRGSYYGRTYYRRKLTPSELSELPEKHHARLNPDMEVERSEVTELKVKPLSQLEDPISFIFRENDA